jgi:hypothetical protein
VAGRSRIPLGGPPPVYLKETNSWLNKQTRRFSQFALARVERAKIYSLSSMRWKPVKPRGTGFACRQASALGEWASVT